jgi:hypothetical protein
VRTEHVTGRVDAAAARWAPTALRWTAGLLWLANVGWKRPPDFGRSGDDCGQLCRYVEYGAEHPVLPGSAWFFEQVVSPNLTAFGWVTLLTECTVAVLLISGRYVRTAAVLGIIQSFAIGVAVANAPDEWYWAYVLMIALHVAVLATAAGARLQPAKTMAVVTAGYGLAVAVVHAGAGLTGGGSWNLFSQENDVPGEWGRNTFPGSIALGAILLAVGIGGWFVATRLDGSRRSNVGWALLAFSLVLLFTYGADGLILGLGSSSTTLCITAALGLALATPASPPTRQDG